MIKIEIKIKDIDYSEIADRVIPIAIQKMSEKNDKSSKLAKILSGMKGMPSKIVRAALGVLPQQTKDELAVHFLSEYKEDIITYVNRMTEEKQIAIEVADVKIETCEE
ncbi:MAG: hypothetical protein K0S47_2916 [Herbinix sp.]|jgi:hypothetical protein|nr:hypothetical protein [Herbinix sp.]